MKEVSSHGESEFEKDDKDASLQQSIPMETSILTLRYNPNEPRQIPYTFEMETNA